MKASITYSIVLVFTTLLSYGQNYQTVQSDEIHYFSTQNHEYFLASRTQSVQMEGADSVFYSYQTVREDANVPDSDPCKFYLGAPWTGQKTVIKPDGRNIFYNWKNEPITIETQAALNDTFLVYTYPTGEWIKGVVTNEIQVFILEEYDDVKIIELISNTAFPFSNDRLMISRNHGFVETFAFYSFPQPYQGASSVTGDNDYPDGYNGSFELVGIDDEGFSKPSTADIFDFDVEDKFQFYASQETADGFFTETYTERTIVNKFVWEDSLVYFVQDSKQQTHYSPGKPAETSIEEGEVEAIWYTHLKSWNTPFLPEEYNGADGWAVLRINSCGDVEEVIRKQAVINDGTGCLIVDEFGSNLIYTAIKNVGWIEPVGESASGTTQYYAELVSYEKADGSTCGSSQYLELENNTISDIDFSVYPNPTAGDVFVEFETTGTDTSIFVVDKQGRKVRVWKGKDTNDAYLDMTDLSPGIYTLIIESEQGTQQTKVVKH